MSRAELVLAGTVLRCHGLRGDVLAEMILTGPAVPLPCGLVFSAGGGRLVLARCSVRDSRRMNLGFDGIDSREDAMPLAGLDLRIDRDAALRIDGFRPLDLLTGMRLVSSRLEGVIQGVEPDRANPLASVRAGDNEFYVPVSLLLVAGEVDWAGRIVSVELPLGIEDLE